MTEPKSNHPEPPPVIPPKPTPPPPPPPPVEDKKEKDKEKKKAEERAAKEKESKELVDKLNAECAEVLEEYGGQESNIPMHHHYWNLRNQIRAELNRFK